MKKFNFLTIFVLVLTTALYVSVQGNEIDDEHFIPDISINPNDTIEETIEIRLLNGYLSLYSLFLKR